MERTSASSFSVVQLLSNVGLRGHRILMRRRFSRWFAQLRGGIAILGVEQPQKIHTTSPQLLFFIRQESQAGSIRLDR